MTYVFLLSQKAQYLSPIDMQNVKTENKPHCFTCQNTVKNICLGDAWKNVGPLQTEHTCGGICHQSVMGFGGSTDYKFGSLALWALRCSLILRCSYRASTVWRPSCMGLNLWLSLVKCLLTLAAFFKVIFGVLTVQWSVIVVHGAAVMDAVVSLLTPVSLLWHSSSARHKPVAFWKCVVLLFLPEKKSNPQTNPTKTSKQGKLDQACGAWCCTAGTVHGSLDGSGAHTCLESL